MVSESLLSKSSIFTIYLQNYINSQVNKLRGQSEISVRKPTVSVHSPNEKVFDTECMTNYRDTSISNQHLLKIRDTMTCIVIHTFLLTLHYVLLSLHFHKNIFSFIKKKNIVFSPLLIQTCS